MVQRVLLNQSGLKVSKPGVNVLTAGPGQLNFSSDWAGMDVYTRGDVSFNWQIRGDGKIGDVPMFTRMLGKTFPTIPFVLFYWDAGGGYVPAGYGHGFALSKKLNDGGGTTGQVNSTWAAVGLVHTDRIDFAGDFIKRVASMPTPVVNIHYVVFDHNF